MNSETFCYWLQGYVELGGERPSLTQWSMIREHAALGAKCLTAGPTAGPTADFTNWFLGFSEACVDFCSEKQWMLVTSRLQKVFTKVTGKLSPKAKAALEDEWLQDYFKPEGHDQSAADVVLGMPKDPVREFITGITGALPNGTRYC